MLYTKAQAILLGLLYCFSSLSKIHIAFCNGAYIDEFFDYWNPKRAGGIDLVAVAGFGDHDVQVANDLEVPIYSDYTLLLKQVDLDAVAIALPNTLHVESVELALEVGIKNILLEKPIASTVKKQMQFC